MKPDKPQRGQTALLYAIVIGAAAVAVLAGILSYRTLIHWAHPAFGPYAPLFAAIVDVGMVVFALATLYKVLKRHSKLGVRLATHLLAGLSIAFNAAAGAGVESILQHATPPLVLMISVETVIGILHRRQQEMAPDLDRIRLARWFLAPVSTAVIRRRMILWEVPSYRVAMEIDRERITRRIRLKRDHNTAWWFRVPRDARVGLKLEILDMARNQATPEPVPVAVPEPVRVPAPEPVPVPRPEPVTEPDPVPSPEPRPTRNRNQPRPGAASKSGPVPALAIPGTGDTAPAANPGTVDHGTGDTAVRRGSAVTDDELRDAIERLQGGLALKDGTRVTNQKGIAKYFGVRPARVSALNQDLKARQAEALALAAATSTTDDHT